MESIPADKLHGSWEQCNNEFLKQQMDCFNELPFLQQEFNAANSMIVILNDEKQVIFANKAFLNLVKMKEFLELAGKNLCKIAKCPYAPDVIKGNGAEEICKNCNTVTAILKIIRMHKESLIETSPAGEKYDEQDVNLSIKIMPLGVMGKTFSVIDFVDNSYFLQKRMLEQIFFHDIINTTGALKGIVGLLKDDVAESLKPEVEFVEEVFESLVENIQGHKDLMDAENGELILKLTSTDTLEELKAISKLYEGHDVASNKTIQIDSGCKKIQFYTDQRLLKRILGNMVKNALEACDEKGVILLSCCRDDEDQTINFSVQNDSYMNDEVQKNIFRPSFSTKGPGRGMGTYSMKLLGETFLKGKVDFFTNKDAGTRFYIKIPDGQVGEN